MSNESYMTTAIKASVNHVKRYEAEVCLICKSSKLIMIYYLK